MPAPLLPAGLRYLRSHGSEDLYTDATGHWTVEVVARTHTIVDDRQRRLRVPYYRVRVYESLGKGTGGTVQRGATGTYAPATAPNPTRLNGRTVTRLARAIVTNRSEL